MSYIQKILLVISAVFFALTLLGALSLGPVVCISFFLLHSLSIILFAYKVYKDGQDSSFLVDTYKQDIGQELAEKDKEIEDMKTLLDVKEGNIIDLNREKDTLSMENEEFKKRLEELKEENTGLTEKIKEKEEKESDKDITAGLLPPVEDENNTATVNIIELAKSAVAELAESAKEASLKVTVQSTEDILLVKADPNRLIVLFKNIIDNSIKYMKKAGSLVITISTINDDIFIVLKDTGEGLNEDETRHIFELNFQGSNRLSGNGLGLTQARAIVEYYGGTIYAKSTAGKGMGIYIHLPA